MGISETLEEGCVYVCRLGNTVTVVCRAGTLWIATSRRAEESRSNLRLNVHVVSPIWENAAAHKHVYVAFRPSPSRVGRHRALDTNAPSDDTTRTPLHAQPASSGVQDKPPHRHSASTMHAAVRTAPLAAPTAARQMGRSHTHFCYVPPVVPGRLPLPHRSLLCYAECPPRVGAKQTHTRGGCLCAQTKVRSTLPPQGRLVAPRFSPTRKPVFPAYCRLREPDASFRRSPPCEQLPDLRTTRARALAYGGARQGPGPALSARRRRGRCRQRGRRGQACSRPGPGPRRRGVPRRHRCRWSPRAPGVWTLGAASAVAALRVHPLLVSRVSRPPECTRAKSGQR